MLDSAWLVARIPFGQTPSGLTLTYVNFAAPAETAVRSQNATLPATQAT